MTFLIFLVVLFSLIVKWYNNKILLLCQAFLVPNRIIVDGSQKGIFQSVEWLHFLRKTVCRAVNFCVIICCRIISMVKSFSCTHSILANCRRCMLNYLWHPTSACQTWTHCWTSLTQPPMSLFGSMRKKKLKCHGIGVTRTSTSQPLSSTMR